MRRTRTDYAINRYYSPDTGRFTTHDPLTELDRPERLNQPQGLNLYPYVMGAPTRYTDPDGCQGEGGAADRHARTVEKDLLRRQKDRAAQARIRDLREDTFQSQSTGSGPRIVFLKNDGTRWNPRKFNPTISSTIEAFYKSDECVRAFAKLGLDLRWLLERGVFIAPTNLLLDPDFGPSKIGITHLVYWLMRKSGITSDSGPPAVTVAAWRAEFALDSGVLDGLPRIFLNVDSVGKGYEFLVEVLAHELIHAGGYPGRKRTGWFEDHDLTFQDLDYLYEGFWELLKVCKSAAGVK